MLHLARHWCCGSRNTLSPRPRSAFCQVLHCCSRFKGVYGRGVTTQCAAASRRADRWTHVLLSPSKDRWARASRWLALAAKLGDAALQHGLGEGHELSNICPSKVAIGQLHRERTECRCLYDAQLTLILGAVHDQVDFVR